MSSAAPGVGSSGGALLGEEAELQQLVAQQRDKIARLKGVSRRRQLRPSGTEQASAPQSLRCHTGRGCGKSAPRAGIGERVLKLPALAGSRFKGYETYVVQDLVLRAQVSRYRRERWLTPDGRTLLAPLPGGIIGHFGPELRRFVLLHRQGRVTVERLIRALRAIGTGVSKRQVMRLLIERQDDFLAASRAVLRAGLQSAAWITVDDTGARHGNANGFSTQIGNDDFTWFGTRANKSRLNFRGLLHAGYTDYVLNAAALTYMRGRALAGPLIRRLAAGSQTRFPDATAWQTHLDCLGLGGLRVTPEPADHLAGHRFAVRSDPVLIATEGAL